MGENKKKNKKRVFFFESSLKINYSFNKIDGKIHTLLNDIKKKKMSMPE